MNPNDDLWRGRASAFHAVSPFGHQGGEAIPSNMSPSSLFNRIPQGYAFNNNSMLLGSSNSMNMLSSMGMQEESARQPKDRRQGRHHFCEGMKVPYNYAITPTEEALNQPSSAKMPLYLSEMLTRELEMQDQRHEREWAEHAALVQQQQMDQVLSAALAERQMLLEAMEQQHEQGGRGSIMLGPGSSPVDPLGLSENPLPRPTKQPRPVRSPDEEKEKVKDGQTSKIGPTTPIDDDPLGLFKNPLPRIVKRYADEESDESVHKIAQRILEVEKEIFQQAQEAIKLYGEGREKEARMMMQAFETQPGQGAETRRTLAERLSLGHNQEPVAAAVEQRYAGQAKNVLKRLHLQEDGRSESKRQRCEDEVGAAADQPGRALPSQVMERGRTERVDAPRQQQGRPELVTFERLAIEQTLELEDIQRRHSQERKKLTETLGLDAIKGALKANVPARKKRAKMLSWRQSTEAREQEQRQQREKAAAEQELQRAQERPTLDLPQKESLEKMLADIEQRHATEVDQLQQRHTAEQERLSEAEDKFAKGMDSLEKRQSKEISQVRRRHSLDRVDVGKAIAREQERRKHLSGMEAMRRIDWNQGKSTETLAEHTWRLAQSGQMLGTASATSCFPQRQKDVVVIDDDASDE